MIVLDGHAMSTRAEAYTYLRAKLPLPAYFGDNLDALYDALTDWPEAQTIVFINFDENNPFHSALRNVLQEASADRGFRTIIE